MIQLAALGKRLSRNGVRWLLGVALTLGAVAHTWGFLHSESIDRFDTFIAGLQMRLEQPVLDPRIVIVDIDTKSLGEVGRFPWSRNIQAKLIDQLFDRYHVSVVGYDVSFPEPDTSSGYGVLERLARTELQDVPELGQRLAGLRNALDYDGQFANAMMGRPVILGFNGSALRRGVLPHPLFTPEDLNGRELLTYNYPGWEGNIAKLQRTAAGAGAFSVVTDEDGIVRSVGLVQQMGDNFYPSLSLAVASQYLKVVAIKPQYTRTVDQLSKNELDEGGVDALLLLQGGKKGIRIPVGDGLTTVVQFRGHGGPDGGAFRYVSAADILAGRAPAGVMKGAIVLVGTTAAGLNDLRSTPVNPEYPGVEVHANVVKSVLDGRFKHRPDTAAATEAAVLLLVGLGLTVALSRFGPAQSIGVVLAVLTVVIAGTQYLYVRQDIVLHVAMLLVLIASLFVLNLGWGYLFEFRKGRALVNRFGEYVAPELVEVMAEDPDAYNMEGESRELTVMFVDVRGFTTISEGLSPKELREYINLYLTAMSEDIRSAYRGTLDKYIGDAVMAFWGAPVRQPDHATRGVATALLMQASAAKLNEDFVKRGWPELKIGIGLNTGMMHVGDMGSAIRRAYTVMGDAVNLGSRLEGITKVYGVGICVGEVTRAEAPEFLYRELDFVRVKGKNKPVAIFQPVGRTGEVDAATLASVDRWHAALALVRAQQWDEAEAILRELHAADPDFGLYDLYLGRIAYFRENPPGENWDGVTTFETK